ncbi:hypothetical protein KAJ38_01055 [Candidatus Pacearchaeota archaeon]|nr:hypothetical protein [Candidatus Pacearchaeota archaeon]
MASHLIIPEGIIQRKKEIWLFNNHFHYDLMDDHNKFSLRDYNLRRAGSYSEVGGDLEELARNLKYYKGFLDDLKGDDSKMQDADFMKALQNSVPPRLLVFGSHIYGGHLKIEEPSYSLDSIRYTHKALSMDIPMIVTEETPEFWQEFSSLWVPKLELLCRLELLVSRGE